MRGRERAIAKEHEADTEIEIAQTEARVARERGVLRLAPDEGERRRQHRDVVDGHAGPENEALIVDARVVVRVRRVHDDGGQAHATSEGLLGARHLACRVPCAAARTRAGPPGREERRDDQHEEKGPSGRHAARSTRQAGPDHAA